MRRRTERAVTAAAGALTLCLTAPRAGAELVPRAAARHAAVIGELELEPELVAGGTALLPIARNEHATLALAAGVEWAVLLPQRADLRFNLGAAGSYVSGAGWGGTCAAFGLLARARDDAATFYTLGFELRCQPAYFHAGWSWGLDLGWQNALSTHIAHSALARRTFDERYPAGVSGISGPRDGWYRFTSTRLRAGLGAGHRFNDHWSGALAFGSLFATQAQGVYFGFNLAQLPIYVEAATEYAW